MQENSLTLSVNVDNDDGTTPAVDSVYTRQNVYQDRSEYIHEDHTLELRDKLGFYRTIPKANGNFRGTAKTSAKLTKDYVVSGVDASTTLVSPAIAEAGFSFPVGMTPAQTLEVRMRLVALILDDDIMADLCDKQEI
jgi:hypothetical protein